MAEMDLIPDDYRRQRVLRRGLRRFLCAYGVLILLLILGKVGLIVHLRHLHGAVQNLQAEEHTARLQQERHAALTTRKADVLQRLALLDGLYGSANVEQILLALDRAVNDDVWFQRLLLQHQSVAVAPQEREPAEGVILSMPGQSQLETWQLKTQLEISGQARDHRALALFIERLSAQPQIAGARLLNSDSHPYQSTEVVDFKLIATIKQQASA